MMRFLIPAAAVLLFAAQAQAQTDTQTTPAPAAPSTTAPAPATTTPPAMAPSTMTAPAKPAKKMTHHMTWQQHFDAANTTHDGHLTKDQAVAGKWGYVSSNFSAMDKDHKGYVTMDDIHGYYAAHHAKKKPATTTPAPAPAPATNG